MRKTIRDVLAAIGFLVPVAIVATLTWFMATKCMADGGINCPLGALTGVHKGLAFAGVMLLAGGLMAFAFTNLDRILNIGAAARNKHNAKGAN